jgi:fatty acid synthase, animal type
MSENEKKNNDDIVISGISGRFPKSNNMYEFEYNLYNKVDMVDDAESRWKHFHPEVPRRSGKIGNVEKSDASYFGILRKHVNQTDPQLRILLENSCEAIIDSGTPLASLKGSRTGVFIACSCNDAQQNFIYQVPDKNESKPG